MLRRSGRQVLGAFPVLFALGCTAGAMDAGDGPDGGSDGGTDGSTTGGATADGGSGTGNRNGGGSASGGAASGGFGGGAGGTVSSVPSLLPARIRRLTNAEYNTSVRALLGTAQSPADDFPPDARQNGYTVNEAQRVDPVLARALDAAATALASEARSRFSNLAPCANPTSEGETCAAAFIDSFGSRAYRRPLDDQDKSGLIGLYRIAAEDATYEDGVELVIRGILQSPGFLYLTEIGDGSEADVVALTDHEVAAELSFLVTGGPPDQELVAALEAGNLATPEGREAQVRRLFASDAGRDRAVQVIREWLGVDRIFNTAKDANAYPAFAAVRPAMAQETEDFVKAVLAAGPGTVSEFLGADWSVIQPELATVYDVSGSGRVDLPNRIGLLNQGAFLSVYAHAHETAPVLRGVAAMRRVACVDIELPTNLDVQIIPPLPDETKTTRERFSIHAQDNACAGCHNLIDPLGFSFEGFDGMGAERTMEGTHAIDSSANVKLGADFDGTFTDSNALAKAIATSDDVKQCFAQQIFRSVAGESQVRPYEAAFLELWQELPAEQQGALLDLLAAFVRSELFVQRGAP